MIAGKVPCSSAARASTADQKLDLQDDALTKAGFKRIFTETAGGAGAERTGIEQALGFARDENRDAASVASTPLFRGRTSTLQPPRLLFSLVATSCVPVSPLLESAG
jgi:hypothetical protein